MNDKLEILCNQMHLAEEEKKYFNHGVLERIIGNKNHDIYCFYIHIDQTLPVKFYIDFQKRLKDSFPSCRVVSASFEVKNISSQLFKDYYFTFLETMKEENPLIELLMDSKVSYEDDWATITVANKAEEMKLRSIEKDLAKLLKKAGYQNVSFEIKIDEEQGLQVQREIEKTLVEEVKKVEATPIQVTSTEEPKKNHFTKGNYQKKTVIDRSNPDVVIGRTIDTDSMHIHDIIGEMNNITIEGTIFGIDVRETKTELKIVTLKVTDYTDSIYVKLFLHDDEEASEVLPKLKTGKFYLFRGNTKDDQYSKELTFTARDILMIDKKIEERMDQANEKRVELHAHTKMSQMDGVVDAKDLVKTAKKWGHKAIAITDHNGAQAFPEVYHLICDINKGLKEGETPFKAIYGTELTMIDDEVNIVVRPNDTIMLDNTYVVFDFETTGFNAGGGDSIIEIGAVKIKNGEIIEKYDELINPGRKLPQKIIDVTNITDEMLQEGKKLLIKGQFRSYNSYDNEKNRLILTVFAKDLVEVEEKNEEEETEMARKDTITNEVVLIGYICKKPIYRQTPFGREISDLLLAVNRAYNKSDYIPCIAWGRNARFCQDIEVGTQVKVVGRVQSRQYEKKHEDGTIENKVAYEVSVGSLEVINQNDDTKQEETTSEMIVNE